MLLSSKTKGVMNMNKQLTALLTTALLLTTLTGCNNKNSSATDNSSLSNFETMFSTTSNSEVVSDDTSSKPVTSSEALSSKAKNENSDLADLVKKEYDISLPVVKASEVLDIEKIDLPKKKGKYYVNYNELFDEKTFLVTLYEGDGISTVTYSENGLYNIEDKTYRVLKNLPDEGYCAWNSDYIVYKVSDGDFLSIPEDESVKLYLYDIKAQESKLIYTYSFDREFEVFGGHWKNGIVLRDGKVYFDDMIMDENSKLQNAFLLSYDIATGKLEKLEDDAQFPIFFKNSIFYIKKDVTNDKLDIVSLDNDYEFEMKEKVINFAATKDRMLSLNVISNDDVNHETTWGIKNMETGECILKTTNTIDLPRGGNDFFSFFDHMTDYTPIIYNTKDNIFIAFDELTGNDVVWYLYENVGVVRDYTEENTAYMFTLK